MLNLDKRLPNSLLPNIFTVPDKKESTTPIIETAEVTCEDYNFNTTGKQLLVYYTCICISCGRICLTMICIFNYNT